VGTVEKTAPVDPGLGSPSPELDVGERPADALPKDDPNQIARRQLLGRMSVALGAGGGLALAVPMVGFVIGPMWRKVPHEWRAVGKIDSFRLGETVLVKFEDSSPLEWAGVTAKTAAWLRRVGKDEFVAFCINCAHLGCPVRWLPDAELFMCPCHGGVYYADGTVAAGPPQHPLTRYRVRIQGDDVELRTDPIPLA
jgi:menaquinol-cytochrome c reductase iron-sulfur subunit